MLAQMLSIGMHVGVRIVAYMFENMQMNVCVCTVNAALAAVRIANVESFHDIHD